MKAFINLLLSVSIGGATMGIVVLLGAYFWPIPSVAYMGNNDTPEVIRAHKIEVVDKRGCVVAKLAADDKLTGVSSLRFFDANGNQRASFGLLKSMEPTLFFMDDQQRARLSIFNFKEDTGIQMYDNASIMRVCMRTALIKGKQKSAIFLLNNQGKKQVEMATDNDQASHLEFCDPAGDQRLTLGLGDADRMGMDLVDERGISRLSAGVSTKGESSIRVSGSDGKLQWHAP